MDGTATVFLVLFLLLLFAAVAYFAYRYYAEDKGGDGVDLQFHIQPGQQAGAQGAGHYQPPQPQQPRGGGQPLPSALMTQVIGHVRLQRLGLI